MKLKSDIFSFLAEHGKVMKFTEGEVIVREKGFADHVFIVIRGSAEVVKEDHFGNNVKLAELDAGSVIGEMGSFLGNERSATVNALTDMTVVVFRHSTFIQQVLKVPDLAYRVIKSLSTRVATLDSELTTLKKNHLMFTVGIFMMNTIKSTSEEVDIIIDYDRLNKFTALEFHKVLEAVADFETVGVLSGLNVISTDDDETKPANIKCRVNTALLKDYVRRLSYA